MPQVRGAEAAARGRCFLVSANLSFSVYFTCRIIIPLAYRMLNNELKFILEPLSSLLFVSQLAKINTC